MGTQNAHEIVTAAIQRGREEHRHRSSARLAGAALEALAAAGYAVIQLPEPQPQSDLYDMHFDVISEDSFMKGPRTPRVCIDKAAGDIYQVCVPSAHITAAEARSIAAALLAAAVSLPIETPTGKEEQ
jgi:hypothetical protein